MSRRGRVIALIALALAGCGGRKRIRQDKDAQVAVPDDPRGSGSGGTASGGTTDEREPNATAAQATPLALGVTGRGALDGSTDVDVYKVAVAGTGELGVTLTGVDGVDLALEVSDASGAVIARSDRGPAAIGEGVPNLGVVKGEYAVTVKEFVKPAKPDKKKKVDAAPAGRTGVSPTYELTTRLLASPDGAEREPDDDAGAANDMFPGDSITGYIGWSGDVDVWKLSLEALNNKNAFDVEVTGVDGVALVVEVSDAAGKSIQSRKGGKAATVALPAIGPRQPEGSPPFHYIKITGDRSNPDAAYTLTVRGRLMGLDEELEPDDKPELAQPLAGASGAMKATSAPGDVDCFAIEAAPDAQALVLTVVSPDGVDTVVEVGVPAGMLAKTDTAGAGGPETIEITIPAGARGTACISFKPAKADPGTPRDYRVEYSLEPVADSLPPEE